jgi:hypothetical protein
MPGGRVAYRLKYVSSGRGKFRIMTAMEFMVRLRALTAPLRLHVAKQEIEPVETAKRSACG